MQNQQHQTLTSILMTLYKPGDLTFLKDYSNYVDAPEDPYQKFEKIIVFAKDELERPISITSLNFQDHVNGKYGISVSPIGVTGKLKFAVIDVDEPNSILDVIKIVIMLGGLGFRAYVSRSSRRGWHITVFFTEDVDSKMVYTLLQKAISSSSLSIPINKTEIFPKLSGISFDRYMPESSGYIKIPLGGKRRSEEYNAFYEVIDSSRLELVADQYNFITTKIKANEPSQLVNFWKKHNCTFSLFQSEDPKLLAKGTSSAKLSDLIVGCKALNCILDPNGPRPGHNARFAIGTAAANCMNGAEEFLKMVDGNPHWDIKKTTAKLNYISKKNYITLTCKKMQADGLCIKGIHPTNGDHCFTLAKKEGFNPSPIRHALNKQSLAKTQPLPFFRELPPSEPFPVSALGPRAEAAANTIINSLKAPAALVCQSLLATMATSTQHLAEIAIDSRIIPILLYLVSIAKSGERKSAIERITNLPLREKEKEWLIQYIKEFDEYRAKKAIYDNKMNQLKRKSLSTMEEGLSDLGPPPEEPVLKAYFFSDVTIEGLIKDMSKGHPSRSFMTDEGGSFLGGHAMNPDNILKTLARLNDLWSNTPVKITRGGELEVRVSGKRLSAHIQIQPGPSDLLLGNELVVSTGALARMLIIQPESTIGKRAYNNEDVSKSLDVQNFYKRVRACIDIQPIFDMDIPGAMAPPTIKLTKDAQKIWEDFYNEIERSIAEGGKLEPIAAFGAKAAEQAIRLAGVLELFENEHATNISAAKITDAITLIRYYCSEQLRLAGYHNIDSKLRLADRLRVWSQKFDHIYAQQVYQFGPPSIRNKEKAMDAISALVDHGWLEKTASMILDGSRRKDVYKVIKVP